MTKNLIIKFRVTEEEKDSIIARSKKAGLNMSNFIRMKLNVSTKRRTAKGFVSTKETKGKRMCPHCDKMISKRGYHRHIKYCIGS